MAEGGIQEDLTCSICFQLFTKPKTLSCMHRFCEKCLHEHIVSKDKSIRIRLGGFHCPLCRQLIKSPDPGEDPSGWAELYKTDFLLTSLIRSVDNTPSIVKPVSKKPPEYKCDVHNEAELDLYCVDCKIIICYICAGIEHRKCEQVKTLKEVVTKQKCEAEKTIDSTNKMMHHITINMKKGIEQCETMKLDVKSQINAWANRRHSKIKEDETEFLTVVEFLYEELYEQINPTLKNICTKIPSFQNTISKFYSEQTSDYDLFKLISEELNVNFLQLKSFKDVVDDIEKLDIRFQNSSEDDFNMKIFINGSEAFTLEDSQPALNEDKQSTKDNVVNISDDPKVSTSIKKSIKAKLAKLKPSFL